MAVPKVISATNFTDESNPTVTFTNTSGKKIRMAIMLVVGSDTTAVLVDTEPAFYTSPYTFDIYSYSINSILEMYPTKSKFTAQIGVIDSKGDFYCVNKTMAVVNGEPEFTTIDGYDADSSIVGVTGNKNILLMGKSNFTIDWTPAVGKKYATIKSYTVEWQDQSKTYTASASHPVSDFVLASSGTSLLRITATDSRGFTTTVEKELDVIEYVPPIAVVTAGRINNYEDETKFKIDASYTSVMVGDVEKNFITCKYRYKQNSETAVWSEWTTINNNEEITLSFPKENEYLIQYTATDAFGEIWQGEYKLNKGKFPMFIDTELNAVGINDFPKTGEALRVAGGSLVAGGLLLANELINNYKFATGDIAKLLNHLGVCAKKHTNVNDTYASYEIIIGNLKIAVGYATITPSKALTPTYNTINYGCTFGDIPYVFMTLAAAPQIATLTLSVQSATESNFQAHIYASNTTKRGFRWLAIGDPLDAECIKNVT